MTIDKRARKRLKYTKRSAAHACAGAIFGETQSLRKVIGMKELGAIGALIRALLSARRLGGDDAALRDARVSFIKRFSAVLASCALVRDDAEALAAAYAAHVLKTQTDPLWWHENARRLTEAWFIWRYAVQNGLIEDEADAPAAPVVMKSERETGQAQIFVERSIRRCDEGRILICCAPETDALRALGIPLITVLVASRPLAMGRAAQDADAFLCAFNGGMFGGEAVAGAIFGDFNPSGRLPISFPRASGQVPVYYNALPGWHTRSGSYCDVQPGPLYAFGEGMGYTSFACDGLSMDAGTLTAQVNVRNTGTREGTETVQFYMRDVVSSVMTPEKQLIGFAQVTLAPGERRQVRYTFPREAFSLVGRDGRRVVEPGEFVLMAGHSSRDGDLLRASFRL